jgi:hypothetical protein
LFFVFIKVFGTLSSLFETEIVIFEDISSSEGVLDLGQPWVLVGCSPCHLTPCSLFDRAALHLFAIIALKLLKFYVVSLLVGKSLLIERPPLYIVELGPFLTDGFNNFWPAETRFFRF